MEAKQVRDLIEAYASVYAQPEEQEVVSEDLQQTVGKALDAAAKNPVVQAIGKVIAPVGKGRGTVTKAEQDAKIKQNLNQDVDLFDLVKGHLMSEGYADTEEAALVIMSNMSEEWRQEILDEAKYGTKAGRKRLAKKIRKGEEIGKSGPGTGFKAVEKAAKEGGAEDPAAVAAAAMYKTYGGKKG